MAKTAEKYLRMAKYAMLYNRTTRLPIEGCYFKINDCKIEDKVEKDPFKLGGEIVADAVKERSFNLSFTAASYRPEVYEQLAKATVTDTALNASGQIIGLANVNGTSVYASGTGIKSISVASGADLKDGKYIIKATAASAVEFYGYSDMSFHDGTDIAFADDTYLIGSALTVTAATGGVAFSSLGITVTGASAISFTPGDTAEFTILRQSATNHAILVTGDTDFDEVGVMLFPDKYNSEYTSIDVFNVLPAGLPMEIKDTWSTFQIGCEMIKDEDRGGYYQINYSEV
jgi:hypothetical protein